MGRLVGRPQRSSWWGGWWAVWEGKPPKPLPVLVLGPAGYTLHCMNPLVAGAVPFLPYENLQMGEYEENPEQCGVEGFIVLVETTPLKTVALITKKA